MAINSTFSSILNEIQLSNLNFTIQLTPFGAYISLKKSAQKDQQGRYSTPSPPLLFLMQQVQQDNFALRDENSKLKAALDNLKDKYEEIVRENEVLVTSLEETHTKVSDMKTTNDKMLIKMNVVENDVARYQSEKIKLESEIKNTKKKHVEEVRELKDDTKALNKLLKQKDKASHDLIKNLENARETVKKNKLEKSALKARITKLEANLRKSEKQLVERNKPAKASKQENDDIKNNNNSILKLESCEGNVEERIVVTTNNSVLSSAVLGELPTSMLSHWNPNLTKPLQDPSSITSMIAHCAVKEKLIGKSEFLKMWAEFLEQIKRDRAEILAEIVK